ncbi:MAG TPA: hypothetical protein DCP92_11870 [Nitrospiraceae bacterium]|jgi:hypothetical protein|nr:hypothetical protein [Nitrospiraceae bacterium]
MLRGSHKKKHTEYLEFSKEEFIHSGGDHLVNGKHIRAIFFFTSRVFYISAFPVIILSAFILHKKAEAGGGLQKVSDIKNVMNQSL